MKKQINPYQAYIINTTKDGMYINDCNGFVFEADDLIEIGQNLIKFAKKHSKQLETHNIERKIRFEQELRGWTGTPKEKKPPKKAYVYLLECDGRYKIGFSDNVERRISELDKRPFPIRLVCKSSLFIGAYEEEQKLHNKYEQFRIYSEWYEFNQDVLNEIIKYISNLGD